MTSKDTKVIITKNTECLQSVEWGVCTVKVIHTEPNHSQKEGTELQVYCCCESLSSRCLNSTNLITFMMHLISHSATDPYFCYIYIEYLGMDLCSSRPQISEDNDDIAFYTTLQTPELVSMPSFLFPSISSWNIILQNAFSCSSHAEFPISTHRHISSNMSWINQT